MPDTFKARCVMPGGVPWITGYVKEGDVVEISAAEADSLRHSAPAYRRFELVDDPLAHDSVAPLVPTGQDDAAQARAQAAAPVLTPPQPQAVSEQPQATPSTSDAAPAPVPAQADGAPPVA